MRWTGRRLCSACCRSRPDLELTVSALLQSVRIVGGRAASDRYQGHC
jgi:hypothetical protein